MLVVGAGLDRQMHAFLRQATNMAFEVVHLGDIRRHLGKLIIACRYRGMEHLRQTIDIIFDEIFQRIFGAFRHHFQSIERDEIVDLGPHLLGSI